MYASVAWQRVSVCFCFGKVVGQVDSALTKFLIFGESAVEDKKIVRAQDSHLSQIWGSPWTVSKLSQEMFVI